MSNILERAKGHFRDKLSEEMKFIDVPEWGEENKPLRIFYKPMNLKSQDRIFKHVREGSLQSLAQTLIERARNEDESKMFKPVHMTEFMNAVDPEVIEHIVTEMAGDEPDDEDAEKN